ncbi:MAG: 4Fe-4S binding protein [Candidatus Helarchaeota archaeon]|nr:4Fe-4S binding protein [Candidatus Helarchaeota archaeon]
MSEINPSKCNGCKKCMTRCQFGAIKFSPAMEKCYISGFWCFGCGLCETTCPQNAIALRLRGQIPGLADIW